MPSFSGSFSDLYSAYAPMVRRVLARMVHPDDIDDAVQETFIKIHGALDSFAQKSNIQTWIYRIALNCAKDFQRKTYSLRRIKEAFVRQKHELLEGSHKTVSRSEIEMFLERISFNHRKVMVLFFLEELSLNEIAEIEKIPLGTVKTRLFHGKKKFAKLWREDYD